jgi:hypothetical protein
MYEDPRGRLWVFTKGGLAYFDGRRFVTVPGVSSKEVFSITGTNRATCGSRATRD